MTSAGIFLSHLQKVDVAASFHSNHKGDTPHSCLKIKITKEIAEIDLCLVVMKTCSHKEPFVDKTVDCFTCKESGTSTCGGCTGTLRLRIMNSMVEIQLALISKKEKIGERNVYVKAPGVFQFTVSMQVCFLSL